MGNFEGTWETTWIGLNPNLRPDQQVGSGIDSLIRVGQRGNFIYYMGKGNQGGISADGVPDFRPQWNVHARTDLAERVLIGRFWGPMWASFTNDGGALGEVRNDSFLNQSGQFFFELGENGRTFTGGYNASSQPNNWHGWDGRKISHNPRFQKTLRATAFPRDLQTVVVTPPTGLL
jgi:hypothetical protein